MFWAKTLEAHEYQDLSFQPTLTIITFLGFKKFLRIFQKKFTRRV